MKDYSNYYGSSHDRMISGGNKLFQMHLNGFDGIDVLVNDIPKKLIITEKFSTKEMLRKVISDHDYLSVGDVIFYDNAYWLLRKIDNKNPIFDTGTMEYSSSSLKWLDSNGEIEEYHFIFNSDNLSNFGITDGRVISLPNDRRNIAIRSTPQSKEIHLSQRFIFDESVWKVVSINRLNPLIELVLESDQIDASKDNIDLRIADYYGRVADYSLTILNGNTASIEKSQTLKLNVELRNNNIVIDNKDVSYEVNDSSIASIDSYGLITPITTGSVIVTVKYKDSSDSISLNITNSTTNNFSATIIGDDFIKYNSAKFYSCEFKNNGETRQDKSTFWLSADDGISPTPLAAIESQDNIGNSCTIRAGDKQGYVVLHVQNTNKLIETSMRIRIKSIL
ncbi:Bacterial Ig-like domain (group 2) [compost metagenome]